MMNEAEKSKTTDRQEGGPKPSRSRFSRMGKAIVEGLAIAGLVTTACNYEVPPLDAIPDAGPDVTSSQDAGPDASADAGHDAGHVDAGPLDGGMEEDAGHEDAGPADGGHDGGPVDAGMDGGPIDSGMDAGPADAGPIDAGPMDAGPLDAGPIDAGMDSGVDGGPVDSGSPDAGIVCGTVTTGSFNGFLNNVTPQVVGSYTFGFLGVDGSGHALVSISCAEGTVDMSISCPVGVDTVVSRPSDGMPAGRTLTVHPTSATPTLAGLIINVTHP